MEGRVEREMKGEGKGRVGEVHGRGGKGRYRGKGERRKMGMEGHGERSRLREKGKVKMGMEEWVEGDKRRRER